MRRLGNLEIVRSQTDDFTRSQGKVVMEAFLSDGTMPPKWVQTASKVFTATDDNQSIYEKNKGLDY